MGAQRRAEVAGIEVGSTETKNGGPPEKGGLGSGPPNQMQSVRYTVSRELKKQQ